MLSKKPKVIQPGSWSDERRPRVLIESPDLSEAGAQGAALREEGYSVAICAGPRHGTGTTGIIRRPSYWDDWEELTSRPETCPLVDGGRCRLAEQADLVITTTEVVDGASVAEAVRTIGVPVLRISSSDLIELELIEEALSANAS